MGGGEEEKTFERKVPLSAKVLVEGLPTEIVSEDRLLTESVANQRRSHLLGWLGLGRG